MGRDCVLRAELVDIGLWLVSEYSREGGRFWKVTEP
jgi:hypothetical protein